MLAKVSKFSVIFVYKKLILGVYIKSFLFQFAGVYHRYDGVVREHPTKNKTAWQKIYKFGKEFIGIDDYKKVLIKDAEVAAKIFQPRWQITSFSADGVNGEELINHINFVVEGLREVYCHQASVWLSTDFYKVVGAVVS